MLERYEDRENDEQLDPGEETEADDELPENDADETSESDAESGETPDDEGELVVTIGDDEPEPEVPAAAPQWVKDTRKENRELKKRVRELERAGAGNSTAQRKDLGPKPKLADFEYDEAKHEAALDDWYKQKRAAEDAERSVQDQQTAQEREWQSRLQAHEKSKAALKVKDYDDAEERVFDSLTETQRGIIIGGAENSALVVLALDKNPKALKELAAIKDPVKYTFAIAKLETKLKTTKRRPVTTPEGAVQRGNAGGALKSEATLEKLRAKAEKTGDYTEVNAYRRKLRSRK